MRLDAGDFEAVWQHICARALADHAQGTLIVSFVKEDGHWIHAVQPERLGVTSRIPRGKGARALPKALFHLEWKKLTRLGVSSHSADPVIWDLLAWYFEDVGRHTRSPLRWTSFAGHARRAETATRDGTPASPGGTRASGIPPLDAATRLVCVEVEGWSRTETCAPPRRDREI